MKFIYSEWEQERKWLRKKAKDARGLTDAEEEQLDRALAKQLKERIGKRASQLWWQLFGIEGHRLDSVEHEARFIAHLDKVFAYPRASQLISVTEAPRHLHTASRFIRNRRVAYQEVEFLAPSASRLLELMLYGYFPFEDTWIFLDRRGERSSDGFNKPKQWLALPRGVVPTDRLGITIEIGIFGSHPIRSENPANLFSSLQPSEKEHLAKEFGSVGTHDQWLAKIVENIFAESRSWLRSRIKISFAGEMDDQQQSLAALLANGGPISGKRVSMLDGNYLNCHPDNLVTRSSRGRRMACSICREPTTPDQSQLIKDTGGSSARLCHACLKWKLKNR
ncbi:hypothetical protein [Pseudomonas chlororaphis]|uniref:hypothetical protein n=1 Tax=Pseudomonas chlororaphis TaxID=587753 RepID=UPI003C2129A5